MSNLKKRIEVLKTSTTSTETVAACNEALTQFSQYSAFTLPAEALQQLEESIANDLLNKLDNTKDLATQDFVVVEKRILGMNNLGVKKALNAVSESDLSKHPQMIYMLEKLKHASTSPEWMVAEQVVASLKAYDWDPIIKEAVSQLEANCTKFAEDIKIYKAVSEARNSRSSFLVNGLEKDIDAYLNNRTATNRSKLLEQLNKFSYDTSIRDLYKVIVESERSFQIKEGSSDAFVNKVYSPVIITEKDEIFAVHGIPYVKNANNMRPLTEEEVKRLPDHFAFLSAFLSKPNVEISENRIKVYSRDKKVEIVEEAEGLNIFINGKGVSKKDFHGVYLNSGIFRYEEKDTISAVAKIVENWDSIFELDFAKTIVPKSRPNRRADVFRLGGSTHIFTVDTVMKESKFYPDCNATQSRNLIMEFANFDLGTTYKGYLVNEEAKIAALETKKKEIFEAINYLETKKNELLSIEDEAIRESDSVKELLSAIDEEITTVKEEYFTVQNEITSLKHITEGANVGDEVEHLKKKQ
jgi:hypothetical protein